MLKLVAYILPNKLGLVVVVIGWPLLDEEESLNEFGNQLLVEQFVELTAVVGTLQNYRHECKLEHCVLLLMRALGSLNFLQGGV